MNIDYAVKNTILSLKRWKLYTCIKKNEIYYKGMEEEISGNYNAFQTKAGNIVWAGAMCLAWTNLKETFTKEPLAFHTERADALKTICNFNNSPFSLKDIDQKSCYIKTGFGNQTQALINKEVRIKFPNFSFGDLNYKLGPQDIISFAYLYKQLNFTHKFVRKQKGSMLFNGIGGIPVQSFLAETEQQKKQIHVVEYKNKDTFSVEIKDETTKDSLFLINNPKITTVDEAIIFTEKAEKNKTQKPSLLKKDYFQMPVIELDCSRDFKEMIGLRFKNPQLKAYSIAVMCQALKLKIDESGAKVENKAVIVAQQSKVLKQQQPRYFIFNKPFWIVMKEPKKHSYMCVKVVMPIDKS